MNSEIVMCETETRWARPLEEVIASAGPPRAALSVEENPLGDSEFFKGKSIAELAREQGVGPVRDISIFAGVIPEDEDVDQMLAEIYRLREP